MKTIIATNGWNETRKFNRVSRWIEIKNVYVTKRHSLFDYAELEAQEENEGLLTYFTFKGKKYAIGQFMRLNRKERFTFIDENKQELIICGYDATTYFPLFCELSNNGEMIRLYESVR